MRSGVTKQPFICALLCVLALVSLQGTARADDAQDETGTEPPAEPSATPADEAEVPAANDPSAETPSNSDGPAPQPAEAEQPVGDPDEPADAQNGPAEEASDAAEVEEVDEEGAEGASGKEVSEKEPDKDADDTAKEGKLHWRKDPSLPRRPGSYLGGGVNYVNHNVWVEETEDHDDLRFGPMHSWGINFRVGDAFTDWFALGFQILISSAKADKNQVSMFGLLLDASFYPWRGLGIRPAVGIGMGFAQGKNKWDMGGGGPGCLSLALLYEFRVGRFFTIAPMVQTTWIVSEGYDQLTIFFGLEFMKWFRTATG